MGRIYSTLKVSAHLEVVGQCGGADRLTLCLPSSRGKGGRRLLGAFSFPSAVDGAGQHISAQRISVPVGKIAKKDGATPVRVNFLAGECVVACREIPLADLRVGLKANTIGRRSALFFSLKAGQNEEVAVYYSRKLLNEHRPSQEDQQERMKAEEHISLLAEADETIKPILPPYAVYTNSSKTAAEVTYCVLTPQVTVIDLLHGQRWAAPQAQPYQERGNVPQADETLDSLTSEVVHRDLGDGQRWVAPQAQPWQERGHSPQADETMDSLNLEVAHRDLGDGQRMREEPRWRSSVGERKGVVLQPSISFPSNKGNEALRGGRNGGRGLVCSLLRCVLAMAFTILVYHVCME